MNPLQLILVGAVRLYQWTLSPAKVYLFGPYSHCRFTPSCSDYAVQAVKTRGAFAGGWLAARRLARCHPWGDCGHDPVPAAGPPDESGRLFGNGAGPVRQHP